jgi:hypothetical protein
MQITDLTLSRRANNCLRRAGIDTVEALCEKTDADLLAIRSFGSGCLQEVREALAQLEASRPKTIADRIRAMSDEELASFMAQYCDGFCQNKKKCRELLDDENDIPEEWCVACALEALRKPIAEAAYG